MMDKPCMLRNGISRKCREITLPAAVALIRRVTHRPTRDALLRLAESDSRNPVMVGSPAIHAVWLLED